MGRNRINDYSIIQITDGIKGIRKSYKVALPEDTLANLHSSSFNDEPIEQEDLVTIINSLGNIINDVMEKVDKETLQSRENMAEYLRSFYQYRY